MKTKNIYISLILLLGVFIIQGCIKDDILDDLTDPLIRISTKLDSLEINTNHQLEYMYLNNIGREENVSASWSSSNDSIVTVDSTGKLNALKYGSATIKVEFDNGSNLLADSFELFVGNSTVMSANSLKGSIRTTSSYELTGDFCLEENGADLSLSFEDNYKASSSLPGLYLYLSNNANSVNSALEIGPVSVFSGKHSYTISNTALSDYGYLVYFCKPFNVKVGDGKIQ